ncbi:DUF1194 domain-containing protein [Aestuariispira insulae]|uniref:Uncharacterized protein DUF1194 n=1 Tax=Aestuariispira insulae TaxID=1461337 RepID=A0A3D9HG71_9PROT|nr:DUF1194 domain-containing protein [Aestuariispira insulae]RED47986.1 uncharacterized protein DUF1194 [Aestuariispira insulae]
MWGGRAALAEPVDLELILAIDCSYSVNRLEFRQQVSGMAQALRSPEVITAIQSGPIGSIAITVVQWSNVRLEAVAIPWTKVSSRADALALADQIDSMPRISELGATAISSVISFSQVLFETSPYQGDRQVLDISGDGRNNTGENILIARDQAVMRGTIINGLAITNDHRTLDFYYRDWVIGGPGAFVVKAQDYGDYARAIQRKLLKEIQYIPVVQLGDPIEQLAFMTKQKKPIIIP